MKNSIILIQVLLCLISFSTMAQDIELQSFDKVIISPHIEVKLIKGTEENVSIDDSSLDKGKINLEVKGNTLRVYLEDAKEITKTTSIYQNGRKVKKPIYIGTQARITITYKQLKELSVRGEETVVIKNGIKRNNFKLKLYGEPLVVFNELHLNLLKVTIYGEGNLELNSGSIQKQTFTTYGGAFIDAFKIDNSITKITSYGAAEYQITASEEIKVTAYGDAVINYTGNPNIKKGITIGELKLNKTKKTSSDLTQSRNSN